MKHRSRKYFSDTLKISNKEFCHYCLRIAKVMPWFFILNRNLEDGDEQCFELLNDEAYLKLYLWRNYFNKVSDLFQPKSIWSWMFGDGKYFTDAWCHWLVGNIWIWRGCLTTGWDYLAIAIALLWPENTLPLDSKQSLKL